jgi:hypothetical protein
MSLESVLARIPGLAGYEAARQQNDQRSMQGIQQASGLMGLLQAVQQQQQKQRDFAKEEQFRARLTAAKTPEERMQIANEFASPKDILSAGSRNPLEGLPDIVKLQLMEKKLREVGNNAAADQIAAKIKKDTQTESAAGQEDRQTLLDARKAYSLGKANEDQMAKATLIYDNLTAPKVVNGNVVKMDLPKEYDPRQRFGLPSNAEALAANPAGKPFTVQVDPNAADVKQTFGEQPGQAPISARPAPAVTELPNTKPLTPIAKANADLAAGRITKAQHEIITGEGVALDEPSIAAAAARYRIDGTLPPNMGRGVQGSANTAAILKRAAADAQAEGQAPEAQRINQIANKAAGGALLQLVKQKNLILAFEKNAQKNADLVIQESEKVDRLGSPAIDRWIQAGKKNIAGDAAVARLDTAVRTFVNEYARITTSVTGGGITSDTARKEIEELLRGAMTKEQVKEVVSLMRQEMGNRKQAYDDQERELRASITTGAKPAATTNIDSLLEKYK